MQLMNRKFFYLVLSSLFLDHEFIIESQQNSGKKKKQRKVRSGILLGASGNLKADGVHLHIQHPESLYPTGQPI